MVVKVAFFKRSPIDGVMDDRIALIEKIRPDFGIRMVTYYESLDGAFEGSARGRWANEADDLVPVLMERLCCVGPDESGGAC